MKGTSSSSSLHVLQGTTLDLSALQAHACSSLATRAEGAPVLFVPLLVQPDAGTYNSQWFTLACGGWSLLQVPHSAMVASQAAMQATRAFRVQSSAAAGREVPPPTC